MHMLINAVVLAMTLPADPAAIAREVPTCRAELEGRQLHTLVEFPGGYVVEGPWEVMHASRGLRPDGSEANVLRAVLDRIVEVDALSGERRTTPFQQGVSITFEGRDHEEVVDNAAQLWCAAVLRMRSGENGRFAPATVAPLRVTRGGPIDRLAIPPGIGWS